MDQSAAARFAGLALKCLHDEYPSHISVTMDRDADARPPRELTPAFYGCFDWHSDVHGHWLLVRLLRLLPDAPFAAQARAELKRSFTAENIAGELGFLKHPGRASFERPYGLAWLLRLCAELREWQDPEAQQWLNDVLPRPINRWKPSARRQTSRRENVLCGSYVLRSWTVPHWLQVQTLIPRPAIPLGPIRESHVEHDQG